MTSTKNWKPLAGGAALLLGGMAVGAVALGSTAASAADGGTSTTPPATTGAPAPGMPGGSLDPSQPMRPDEELLTGSTADKVTAAATAEYPDATVQRVETDSDGVYEAHIVTSDGEQLVVQVGKDFSVTGTQSLPAPGHAPAGPGDAPGDESSSDTGSSTPSAAA